MDFVKKEDAEFGLQLKSFSDGLNSTSAPNAATVGLLPADATEAKNDAAYMNYVLQQQNKSQDFSQAYTMYKNNVRKGAAEQL